MDSQASSSKTSSTRSATKRTLEDKSDEAFCCTICLDTLTRTGSHKPVCLKCGHIFGENCLIKWINVGNESGARCPTCNTEASLNDIRVLNTNNVIDNTAEITTLKLQLEQENREKKLLKKEGDELRSKAVNLNIEVTKLKILYSGPNAPAAYHGTVALCDNQSSRVMTYNKSSGTLVMSQQSNTTLNSHMIRRMNLTLTAIYNEYVCAHKKEIRDMAFHPLENNHLASVGLDKQICLTDLNNYRVVSSISVPEPLWSCCWAGDNTHVLVVGSQMGSVFYIDRRTLKVFNSEITKSFGCVSLNPLPPSQSRSFMSGGFLKTRLDQLSVYEENMDNDHYTYKETELPLDGMWGSTSYDSHSNLVLTSTRPQGPNKTVKHIVSKLADFDAEGSVLTPVITFYGEDRSTHLNRSCLVPSGRRYNNDTLACFYDEGSSTIKVFNINKKQNLHNFTVTDNILDLCPLTGLYRDGRRMLAGLSKNSVSFYTV